jgi:menaquinone-dependent protoporphyrinogen IX oxidase
VEEKDKIPEALDVAGLTDDPLIARTIKDDPLIRFLGKWGGQILVAALVVGAVAYAKWQFDEARVSEVKRAADLFAGVRSQYSELLALQNERDQARAELAALPAGDDKKKTEVESKIKKIETDFNDRLKPLEQALLSLGDVREPYNNFVPLYSALVAQLKGDTNAAKHSLNASSWQEISDTNSSERLVAELKSLYLGRLLLDDSGSVTQGRRMLLDLANQGAFVYVSAAFTLARVAQSAEEKKEVRAAIEGLLQRHPEQRELLQPELDRL